MVDEIEGERLNSISVSRTEVLKKLKEMDKRKAMGVQGGAQNGGYDDEQGSYQLVAHDHIQYRYEVIKIIGELQTSLAF